MLEADRLREDPRIAQAKALILEAVADHQKRLEMQGPNTPDEWVKRAADARGAPLFYPYVGSGIGRGALVELTDGSVKYDFISGIGVHFGHSMPEMIEASVSAAIDDTIMQGNLQQTRESILLMEKFKQLSGFDTCFLTTSGAMANENALKIAFQHAYPEKRLLAFKHNFAGRTCVLAHVTDKEAYRVGIPKTVDVDTIPFGAGEIPKGQYAAMIFELVQGEGGFNVAEKAWLQEMVAHCKEQGILVIVDEVQTFGRTDHPFAFQHFDIEPDIVTIGKLANVCATLYRKELQPKPGLLSQTFTASTSMVYASLAIIDRLEKEHFGPNGKNMQVHKRFAHHFERMGLTGPYGLGLMVAFTPDGDPVELLHKLFDAGVIAFLASGRIRFLVPAGGVTMEDIDHVCAILEKVLC